MYHDYFGITENPFSITPDPRYLFMSKGHEEALAHLLYGVSEGGGFVLLTGEVGTGKTSVCRCLLEQLPDTASVALILNPRLDEIELLASICDELGVAYPKDTRSLKVLVDSLNRHLLELHAAGRHGVVIIDEAQDLSPQVLEQVRLLTNLETATRKLLQVILIGQPELNVLLQRRELRQVVQRVTARYHLQPLGRADSQAYIQHRLNVGGLDPELFSRRAIAAVYRHARGVPRLINSLCDRCLLGAYTQNRKAVDAQMVKQSAREVFGRPVRQRLGMPARLAWLGAAAAFAGALLLLDPLDFGVLPQAGDWRTKFGAVVSGGEETAPDETPQSAPDRQSDGKQADSPLDPTTVNGRPGSSRAVGESFDDQAPASRPGAAAVEAAEDVGPEVAETEMESEPVIALSAVLESDPPAETRVETQPEANGESGDEVRGSPYDADWGDVSRTASDPRPVEVAAAIGAEPDPDSSVGHVTETPDQDDTGLPGDGATASSGTADPLGAKGVETEETAPLHIVPEPRALHAAAMDSAPPTSTAEEDRTADSKAIQATETKGTGDGSAIQTAKVTEMGPALTIDDLFTRPSLSVGRDSALAALFGLWGLDAQRLGGPVDCARSADLGVKCLTEKTPWDTLIGFNRPVLITLRDESDGRARVVLSAVDGDRATLLAGTEQVIDDISTVRSLWSGEYVMLWQPPPFYSGLLAFGARGQEVAWLKNRLAEARGEPRAEVRDAVFDAALLEKVKAFQQSRGLEPDGMVGVRTLIHLNTAAKAAGVPLLRPSAP